MEKERDNSVLLLLKIARIMKITLILALAGVLQISATTYAQEHRISVSVENGTFYDVVSQIERQSEFMFFYKSEEIDNNQRISLTAKDKLVSEILNEITKNNNLTYKITGKHIIITKATETSQLRLSCRYRNNRRNEVFQSPVCLWDKFYCSYLFFMTNLRFAEWFSESKVYWTKDNDVSRYRQDRYGPFFVYLCG